MTKINIYKNTYDEYEVPTVVGISGSDAISFESSKQDAIDCATYHHGSDVVIRFRAGTYTINEEN
tara:strand:- start:23 stop:217 length:195 start_codon:yes stop_codon:yes gene_type:complete